MRRHRTDHTTDGWAAAQQISTVSKRNTVSSAAASPHVKTRIIADQTARAA